MSICQVCLSDQYEERTGVTVGADDFGLPDATIQGATVGVCKECGAESIGFADTGSVIRQLRSALVRIDRELTGSEFAFLRRNLGATARKYAEVTGVHHTSISRIENAPEVTTAQDALIRSLTLLDLLAGNALEHMASRDLQKVEALVDATQSHAPKHVPFEEHFSEGYVFALDVKVDTSIGRPLSSNFRRDARRRKSWVSESRGDYASSN